MANSLIPFPSWVKIASEKPIPSFARFCPLEVEEDVIDQLQDHLSTLLSCSLTCRAWLPRSRAHILRKVRFETRESLDAFYNYLDDHPRMRPLIQSVTMDPGQHERCPSLLRDIIPIQLVSRLPNLRRWHIRNDHSCDQTRDLSFNSTTLLSLSLSSTIGELALSFVEFASVGQLMRFLLAFRRLHDLRCTSIRYRRGSDTGLGWLKTSLKHRLRLRALYVVDIKEDLLASLVDFTRSTLETLEIRGREQTSAIPLYPRDYNTTLHHAGAWLKANRSLPVLKRLLIDLDYFNASASDELAPSSMDKGVCLSLQCLNEVIILKLRRYQGFPSCSEPLLRRGFQNLRKQATVEVRHVGNMPIGGHQSCVNALAVSSDGRLIASGSDDCHIVVWDSRKHVVLAEWAAHDSAVIVLAFSPDGRRILSVARYGDISVWNVEDGYKLAGRFFERSRARSRCARDCVWSPDGSKLMTITKQLHISPDVATRQTSGATIVWDADTHQQLYEVYSKAHSMFSPDGRWLAGHDSGRNDCCLWNAATGDLGVVLSLAADDDTSPVGVEAVVFSPDSTRLAVAYTPMRASIPCGVHVFYVETGSLLRTFEHHLPVTMLAFSPDGLRLLSTSGRTTTAYDLRSGRMLLSQDGLPGNWEQVYLHKQGSDAIYSYSLYRNKVYFSNAPYYDGDAPYFGAIVEHSLSSCVTCVAFSPDGEDFVSGASDGTVYIRRLFPSVGGGDNPVRLSLRRHGNMTR